MSGATPTTIAAAGEAQKPKALRPELLAPAGDWECAKAAVENGADAIYFGLERFNARMRARNFTAADLPRLLAYLHGRGVKGYVTFNTLIFANEMAEARDHLLSIISAGADAVIVQDVGICRLIRELSPDFPIHASTQMTITSAAGVEFAAKLGCQLVVLARECSIREIEKIREKLSGSSVAPELPLEVFVHGALCVAYSGQCLTSEALGGRSANRGECAQACRMPYELISDGKTIPLGDKRYLLSPQDLAGLELVTDLVRAGVASFKIEGRLKTPEYVANITRVYREAIDAAMPPAPTPNLPIPLRASAPPRESLSLASTPTPPDSAFKKLIEANRYDIEMAFSRGLHTGWLGGINNQQLVHARFGKKRGVYLGEVLRIDRDRVVTNLQAPLKAGDGVVFDAGHPETPEEGARVYKVVPRGAEALLEFGRGDLDFSRIHPGDKIWKTSDPELDRRLRQSFAGAAPKFQREISMDVYGRVGEPLRVVARDELGHVVEAATKSPLAAAHSQPLTTARLREQLERLGGTPFKLGSMASHLEGEVMVPVSELNQARRQIVAALEHLRAQPKRWQLKPDAVQESTRREQTHPPSSAIGSSFEMNVLVRSLPQLDALLASDISFRRVYCEFEDPKAYRFAVERFRAGVKARLTREAPPLIYVAPPRIFKPGEEWILQQVASSQADGWLLRNYDHLSFFQSGHRLGDFSLNVANRLSAEYFIHEYELERVTASYDLNIQQLEALLSSAPPEWFEITLHQHIPMFHMEHCVFCAFLTNGTDFRNCGRPCDRQQVKLRDRVGAEHPLKADAGCRNTLFNAVAQTGAEFFDRLAALGARAFRIEFLGEAPGELMHTLQKYQQLFEGRITGARLWRELKLLNQLGVTRGQLDEESRGRARSHKDR